MIFFVSPSGCQSALNQSEGQEETKSQHNARISHSLVTRSHCSRLVETGRTYVLSKRITHPTTFLGECEPMNTYKLFALLILTITWTSLAKTGREVVILTESRADSSSGCPQ